MNPCIPALETHPLQIPHSSTSYIYNSSWMSLISEFLSSYLSALSMQKYGSVKGHLSQEL